MNRIVPMSAVHLLFSCVLVSCSGETTIRDTGDAFTHDDASVDLDGSIGDAGQTQDVPELPDGSQRDTGNFPVANFGPRLYHFRVESDQRDRVYFDTTEPITASNANGFVISNNTVRDVHTNPGETTGHYFTVSEPFDFWDNNTIRYEGGSDVMDSDDERPSTFTLRYIENDIPEPTSTGTRYYVSTSGDDTDDGLSEATAWRTLTYALRDGSAVGEGDVVHVKAGDYGAENIVSNVQGSATNPVQVVGYWRTPGDISSLYYTDLGAPLDPAQMPLFDGGDTEAGQGFVHEESRSNIIYRNLQFQNYRSGFKLRYEHENILVERIIVKDIGSANTGTDGRGIDAWSNGFNANTNLRFQDCVSMNSQEMNFGMSGSNNLAENIRTYNDRSLGGTDTELATDYYFSVQGSDNIVRNSLIDKHVSTGFGGHGFSVKADGEISEHNLFEHNLSINVAGAFVSRHLIAQRNVFRHNESHADVEYRSRFDYLPGGGACTNGASFNIYESNYFHHLAAAISIGGGSESRTPGAEAGEGNIFRNNVIHDVTRVIGFSNSSDPMKLSSNNLIYHNTIHGADELFRFRADGGGLTYSGNEFRNNIVSNVAAYYTTSGSVDGLPEADELLVDHNDFHGGFEAAGTAPLSAEPGFVDAAALDFRLRSDSQCIDAGADLDEVTRDYDGAPRPQGGARDLGAYEYSE